MLTRALSLVARAQHDRAAHLLTETRSILKGLAKGGLPPIPPPPPTGALPLLPLPGQGRISRMQEGKSSPPSLSPTASVAHLPPPQPPPLGALPTPREQSVGPATAAGIDPAVVAALDAELEGSLEWIHHPAVFGRDSRKAVLQAVGVIGSQRAWTTRSAVEAMWAMRVGGVKRGLEACRNWGDGGGEGLEGVREET